MLLVVASSDRPAYLQKCLDAVLAHYPGPPALLPIVISEDGASDGVQRVVDGFRRAFGAAYGGGGAGGFVTHLHHPQRRRQQQQRQQQQRQQQQEPTTWRQWLLRGPASEEESEGDGGYHRLSRHYAWAVGQAFVAHAEPRTAADKVIVLEEDLEVSPDFFAYFGALAPALLDAATEDNTSTSSTPLMAISAWNDNGMGDRLDPLDSSSSSSSHPRSRAVHRSDFFPGLGWMLARPVWEELQPKWPAVYWDDWLRQPAQRRGRHFLRPAVSRTHHFGRNGTSHGQFSALLDTNRLSDAPASAWADEGAVDREVAAVVDEGAYDRALVARVEAAKEMDWAALKLHLLLPPPPSRQRRPGGGGGAGIRVVYYEPLGAEEAQENGHHVAAALPPSFSRIARGLGIFQDLKSGVPRTGYKGVVASYLPPPLDAHVYLVPSDWRARLPSPSSVGSRDGEEEGPSSPFSSSSMASPL